MKTALLASAVLVGLPAVAFANGPELIGITRAVSVAERTLAGHAMEAELETRRGSLVYEIDLVRAGVLHRAMVDARTGKMVNVAKPRVEGKVRGWIDPQRFRRAEQAKPLGQTLAAIEEQTDGQVHSVGFELRDERAFYEIEVATAAGTAILEVDAVSGQRVAMHLPEQ